MDLDTAYKKLKLPLNILVSHPQTANRNCTKCLKIKNTGSSCSFCLICIVQMEAVTSLQIAKLDLRTVGLLISYLITERIGELFTFKPGWEVGPSHCRKCHAPATKLSSITSVAPAPELNFFKRSSDSSSSSGSTKQGRQRVASVLISDH